MSGCKKEEPFTYKDPSQLEETEFTFIPSQPNSKAETAMVFYGCSYFATTSLVALNDKIEIIKEFNSEQGWPCNLKKDTISFGYLSKGTYHVTLKIMDSNPSATNSIFYSEDKTLIVAGK
ncbi:MAG TPA: hypothetical protein VKA38_06465 [Draconibacterium sp.]|nr:hypothetical protein [Draconibacterium sp.]